VPERRLPGMRARGAARLRARLPQLFDGHGQEMVAVNVVCHWAGIDRGRLAEHRGHLRGHARKAPRRPRRRGRASGRGLRHLAQHARVRRVRAVLGASRPDHGAGPTPAPTRPGLPPWFPAGDDTPRPVRMSKFDGEARGFAYALKPDFSRRISLEPRLLADGSRSTFGTRGKPIGGASRVELALALDRAGLDARCSCAATTWSPQVATSRLSHARHRRAEPANKLISPVGRPRQGDGAFYAPAQ